MQSGRPHFQRVGFCRPASILLRSSTDGLRSGTEGSSAEFHAYAKGPLAVNLTPLTTGVRACREIERDGEQHIDLHACVVRAHPRSALPNPSARPLLLASAGYARSVVQAQSLGFFQREIRLICLPPPGAESSKRPITGYDTAQAGRR
jgi:hypothetical protein